MVITQQNAAASLPAQWHWAVCCQQTKRSEEAGQRGRCLESLTGLPPGSSFPLHGHCTLHWGEQAETGEARTGRNRDCRLRGTLRSNAGVGAFSLGKLPAPTFVGEVARTLLGLWMLLAPGLRNSWGQHICPAVRHNGRTPSEVGPLRLWGLRFLCQWGASPTRGSPAWSVREGSPRKLGWTASTGSEVLMWPPNQEHQHLLGTQTCTSPSAPDPGFLSQKLWGGVQ